MKIYYFVIAAISLFIACTPEETNSSETDEPGIGLDDKVHVTGVSLDKQSLSLKQGESTQLIASVIPANSVDKSVTWKSENTEIATVEEGKVTAIKDGTTIIIVTTNDGGKTATCNVIVEKNLAPVVTVGAEKISAVSVVLMGKANLGTSTASDLKIGFQYSKSAGILPSNSTSVEAQEADSDYNYTSALIELEPATKYYFRSYVRQNGVDTFGETKEFITKDISSILETFEATEVEADCAVLNGKLDLTDVEYENIKYGFYWGASEDSQSTFINAKTKDSAMITSMGGLSHKTQYWYKSYAKIDSQEFCGEVKTFTTDVIPVESVSLSKTEYTFNRIGNSLTMNATVFPADATDKRLDWSSDNETVATVDNDGRVTAKDNGKATITVKTKDQGKSATCTITVEQWVSGMSLNKTSLTLNEGDEDTLILTITPSNAANKAVKWTSSDVSVATVDESGKITAVSKGTAIIKAEAIDGSGKNVTCSVAVRRLVSEITLDKKSIILYRGVSNVKEVIKATVSPADADNTNVTWSSSNTSVATVNWSGEVTGKTPGTTVITVLAQDGSNVTATCEVEVRQYVTNITLDDLDLLIGENVTASYRISPTNSYSSDLTWSSDNMSVVEVTNDGTVTAKSKGKATITAIADDGSGVTATCNVIVSNPCPQGAVDMGVRSSEGYRVYWATCNLGANTPEDYGEYYAWGETQKKSNYSWSNYLWGTSSTKLTKYNTDSSYGIVDNKTVLDPEDDVAHEKLGGNWRMPTDAEWTDLINKCTWLWTTQNGVKGMLVTSKEGESIFLRAAGCQVGKDFSPATASGLYWSSSLYKDYPDRARRLYFSSVQLLRDYGEDRCLGLTIRPVTE